MVFLHLYITGLPRLRWCVYKSIGTSVDPAQIARRHRLIWIFADRKSLERWFPYAAVQLAMFLFPRNNNSAAFRNPYFYACVKLIRKWKRRENLIRAHVSILSLVLLLFPFVFRFGAVGLNLFLTSIAKQSFKLTLIMLKICILEI